MHVRSFIGLQSCLWCPVATGSWVANPRGETDTERLKLSMKQTSHNWNRIESITKRSTTNVNRNMRFSIQLSLLLITLLEGVSGFFFGSPIIDPDDPLENTGDYGVDKLPVTIPLDSDILNAEIFIPTGHDLYGFVLFMPGFGTSFKAYEVYLTHLASHGYLTVGLDFASAGFTFESEHDLKAQQALDVIAYIQSLDSQYETLPVITAGHSQGGKIAFYAASIDADNVISAVMAMDPVNAGGGPCFINPNGCRDYPVAPNIESKQQGVLHRMSQDTSSLIFRSAPDRWTNPDEQFNAEYFFFGSDGKGMDASPSPTWYYDFGNFAHTGYVPLFCSEEVQVMKRTMVAFLQQQIQDIDRTQYMTGDIIQADIRSGHVVDVDYR